MKKLALSILVGLSLLASPTFSSSKIETVKTETKDVTVYTTKTGSKFHRDGCQYLRRSAYKTTKKAALAAGYEACSVCKP